MFVIIEKEHKDNLFAHINIINPSIQFAEELEPDNQLSFLDVLIRRDISDTLHTIVYRKNTHTNH